MCTRANFYWIFVLEADSLIFFPLSNYIQDTQVMPRVVPCVDLVVDPFQFLPSPLQNCRPIS